jgi:hypothetical protein
MPIAIDYSFRSFSFFFSEAARRPAHKKQMPFLVERGAWPRCQGREVCVYRSEAKTLEEKRAAQAQVFSTKDRKNGRLAGVYCGLGRQISKSFFL